MPLTTTASLDRLNSLVAQGAHAHEGPLPMSRFRPNVTIEGTEAWAEDGWTRVTIGEMTFRVPEPSGRCVVTTTDQDTSRRGREPLRTLDRHRSVGGRLLFGVNLVPLSPGTLRVGDPLEVVARHALRRPAARRGNPGPLWRVGQREGSVREPGRGCVPCGRSADSGAGGATRCGAPPTSRRPGRRSPCSCWSRRPRR
ncbi:MOSC domain-containing protein [Streptomyces sp. DSM 41972]|uniref:MOSC domain-containing protein n=1 Tax=Streptomyces althioticus subsp. attaecolombicae TaxID=3075534 RepID=A0ABU3I0D0_9ACTN|nr:MOSC domain-containing protein [Streptomyces sp. DSM 41972]